MNNSLNGINILVTRAAHQATELNKLIEQFGGCPINLPLQRIIHTSYLPEQNELIKLVNEVDWILFTSVNSVLYFVQSITNEVNDIVKNKKIAAVGKKTQSILEENGLKVSFIPSKFTGINLSLELGNQVEKGTKFLFIRGSLASETVPVTLLELGHFVNKLTVYETVPNPEVKDELINLLMSNQLHVITFLNPNSVQQFCYLTEKEIKLNHLENIKIACIGEVTASEANKRGFQNILVPSISTIESLLQKIADDYSNE